MSAHTHVHNCSHMVAERGRPRLAKHIVDVLVPLITEEIVEVLKTVFQEQISERICKQIVEQAAEVLKTSSRDRTLQRAAERIPKVPVPEMTKQLVEVPETVSQDRIKQRTVEQIVDAPVPQAVEELADVFRVFSQDRIQQRIVEQIIPATSLAEMIIEVPVIQTPERTQQVVNTNVQHIVDIVEVERPEIIKQTGQKPITQEKINQVTKHVEVPLVQFLDKVDEIPVVAQRQIPIMVQTIQKTTDIPQLQCIDKVIDVPVVSVAQAPHVQIVEKTVESPQMQIAEKTVEISQLQAAEKTMLLETRETQTIQGIQTSESLKPDDPDAEIKFFVEEELHGVAGPVFDANGNRVANELGGRNCVTGEMRKNKLPSRLDLNSAISDDIDWQCKHYTGCGVRKLHESGTALVEGMDAPVIMQRQVPIVRKVQKTVEASQAQPTDRVMNAPVIMQRHVPAVQVAQKTIASPTENDHVTQEAEKYRDGDKVDKTKIKAKSSLENHCTVMRNTSIVKDMRSKFDVGHTKGTEKSAHARNQSDKNRWRKKQEFEATQYPQDAQERADLTNQRHVLAIRNAHKTVGVPRVQYIDKVADIPVDIQRQVSTLQAGQHIDDVEDVPAVTQSEIPNIPDDDEDWLEQESKKRKLPVPAETVFESRADESDFDRFDDLVLPSPEGKTLFVSIASGYEAEDEPEKQQEMTLSLVQGEESKLVDETDAESAGRELVQMVHMASDMSDVKNELAHVRELLGVLVRRERSAETKAEIAGRRLDRMDREQTEADDAKQEANLQEALANQSKAVKVVVDKWFVDKGYGFGKAPTGEVVFIHASTVQGAEVLTIGTDAWVQVVNDDARAQGGYRAKRAWERDAWKAERYKEQANKVAQRVRRAAALTAELAAQSEKKTAVCDQPLGLDELARHIEAPNMGAGGSHHQAAMMPDPWATYKCPSAEEGQTT